MADATTRLVSRDPAIDDAWTYLAAIVRGSDDAIVGKTLDGIITSWNPAAERIFGYSADEVIGQSITVIVPVDRRGEEADVLARLRRGETIDHFETVRIAKDGRAVDISLTVSPIRDAGGRIIGASKIARDITEAKRADAARQAAEAEVRRLNEELEKRVTSRTAELLAVNAELEAFCYSVAHDLRSPLRHMTSFITLLERRAAATLDNQARRYVRIVGESARRLSSLIEDLLEFSRAGRSELRRVSVNLDDVVKQVLSTLGPESEGRRIAWDIASLPTVVGDPTMLSSVFTNLLGNALKFTRPRLDTFITIGAIASRADDVVVFVRDNGVGFDMRYVDRLFGLFQRLHHDDEFEGTGIGLAMARRILHRHEGRIWAESELGEGATFFVSLPRSA
jgi:PAS domain S-box-containing protein